jgi:hypothetical protein
MIRLLGQRPSGSDRSTFDEILEDAGQSDHGSIFNTPDEESTEQGQGEKKIDGEVKPSA